MKGAGYEYVVIDDCWQVKRDARRKIVADPEHFPSGMRALAKAIHGKGLKFGIYSDAGSMTCGKRPGSKDHEAQDAKTYAEWGRRLSEVRTGATPTDRTRATPTRK